MHFYLLLAMGYLDPEAIPCRVARVPYSMYRQVSFVCFAVATLHNRNSHFSDFFCLLEIRVGGLQFESSQGIQV